MLEMELTFEFMPAIEGGSGGCLHCGYQHSILPMDAIIAVGFGSATLEKDGQVVYDENGVDEDEFISAKEAEEMASSDPNHDWRIHLIAPLSERHYQRQGDEHWVLYEKGEGFA
jgi:hypothetical protein